jgi:hypothetical protein
MMRIKGKANHFLISLFEHADAIEDKLESGKVRENRVRKSYSWDGIELETCNDFQKT